MSSRPSNSDEYPVRLQKFLARAGVASRRGSESLMTAGRVTVNGEVVTELGTKVTPAVDAVAVDGTLVQMSGQSVYLILNKPAGYMSTMSDPYARHTVAELVPTDLYPGLFPVGRLDKDTTGLLLFTTDGEFAHRILHPRWQVYKRYIVEVERILREGELKWLRDGVMLEDGMTAPALVERIRSYRSQDPHENTDTLSVSIYEGRNRQVRRMMETIGHPVIKLERSAFGAVELEALEPGVWRLLTDEEVANLKLLVENPGFEKESA